MIEFKHVTTIAAVETFKSANNVFSALLREVRELSKKKPDATLSGSKVKIINTVLSDLLTFLSVEPEGKYLETIEDDKLPQVSDALMMMAQFEAALNGFQKRYYQTVGGDAYSIGEYYWITEEQLKEWQ